MSGPVDLPDPVDGWTWTRHHYDDAPLQIARNQTRHGDDIDLEIGASGDLEIEVAYRTMAYDGSCSHSFSIPREVLLALFADAQARGVLPPADEIERRAMPGKTPGES